MSNNRKRNLKKLAKNLVTATALLSPLSTSMTSAGEGLGQSTQESSGLDTALKIGGLTLATAATTATIYHQKQSREFEQNQALDTKNMSKIQQERWDLEKISTEEQATAVRACQKTQLNPGVALTTWKFFQGLPKKYKSTAPSISLPDFLSILKKEDTVGGKLAKSMYEYTAVGCNQSQFTGRLYKEFAGMARKKIKAFEMKFKDLEKCSWLTDVSYEEAEDLLAFLSISRTAAQSGYFRGVDIVSNNNNQGQVYRAPDIVMEERNNLGAVVNPAVNPAGANFKGAKKLSKLHYEIGNALLEGDLKKLLEDHLPCAFTISRISDHAGGDVFAAAQGAHHAEDDIAAGTKGKRAAGAGAENNEVKKKLLKGDFCAWLAVGDEIGNNAWVDLAPQDSTWHRSLISLNSPGEYLDRKDLRKIKSAIGSKYYNLSKKDANQHEQEIVGL